MDQHWKSKTNEKIIGNWGGRSLGRSLIQSSLVSSLASHLLSKMAAGDSFLLIWEKWAGFRAGSSNWSLVDCGKILVVIDMIEFWLGVHNTDSWCFLNMADWVKLIGATTECRATFNHAPNEPARLADSEVSALFTWNQGSYIDLIVRNVVQTSEISHCSSSKVLAIFPVFLWYSV